MLHLNLLSCVILWFACSYMWGYQHYRDDVRLFCLLWWWRGSIGQMGWMGGWRETAEQTPWIRLCHYYEHQTIFVMTLKSWRLGRCLDQTVLTLHALTGAKKKKENSLKANNHTWYNWMSDSTLFQEGEKTCQTSSLFTRQYWKCYKVTRGNSFVLVLGQFF